MTVTAIPTQTWVKVASNVKVGSILPIERIAPSGYLFTIRSTGSAAPTDGNTVDAKELPYAGGIISNDTAIDVYIAVTGAKAGRVRYDA